MTVTPRKHSLPGVIHTTDGTVVIGNGSSGANWEFSLVFAGDYSCRLFACPEGGSGDIRFVTMMFSSLDDMRDHLEERLARESLPEQVAAEILTVAAAFRFDAEIAHLTG